MSRTFVCLSGAWMGGWTWAFVAERLRAAGATLAEPFENPFGDRLMFFDDPAGNRAQIVARKAELPV